MKNTQRCLALILSVLLLLSTVPVSVFALESNAVVFAGGDGTENDPYQVSTPEQLNAVRNDLSAYYIQINDIDMTDWGNWEPIGTYSNAFKGMYDGNGYAVKNLSVNITSSDKVYVGLFGYISSILHHEKTVTNLGIVNGNFYGKSLDSDVYVGSIVGYIEYGSILNCNSNSEVFALSLSDYTYVGGIAGKNLYSTIKNSYNRGNIFVTTTSNANYYEVYVGGIIGSNFYSTTTNCYNSGSIYVSAEFPASLHSETEAGGISGENFNGEIIDCYNTGDVFASSEKSAWTGGISGYNCYGAKIKNCYNLGVVSAESSYDIASGIANAATVENCYYLNIINKGVGFDIDTAIKCTSEQMKNQETFVGFDFETVWTFSTDSGYLYPILQSITNNSGAVVPGNTIKQWSFEEPIVIIDVGETKTLNVHSRDVANVNGELVYSNDKVVNASDIDWNAELYEDSGVIKIDDNGQITGLSEGYEHISINSKNDLNLSTFCHVYVGDPNVLNYTSTYDTKQYYADGGFYSEVSSISDCVEIYILLENKLKEAVANISGIDEIIAKDTEKETFKDIKPITLTASVNGTGLSFDRDTYQNTYTVTLDAISLAQAVDDILMLFPHNLNVASFGNNYTVTVTLESESFETITDEYSFTVENLETKSANEHIDFLSSNKDYKVSKQNIYGETMITLKNDAEYKWSKYSTLDFDNYYEIVLADVIISMLQVNQVEIHSLVSSVLKEWRGTYKTLLGGITTIVEDNYADRFGNTERKIDKLLKKSKYETDGIYVKDELHETVMDLLGNANNANKINNVFKAMDKTGQVFGMVNLGGNILSDAVDWGNKISIFNAYVNADNEFKTVMKSFADSIPESEKKMREAIYDYVNYAESDSGQISELLESFSGLMKNVTLDVFSSCVGGRMIDYLGVQLVNWVGTATVGGVAFSTTATFATVKTTLGSVSTGVTLGLCFSDLICDSSGKAAEMGKVVAMSEFSPYVNQTLLHYENKLKEDKNVSATTYYEYAFALHKATQSYIMQHTVNSLETKRDSLIIRIFNRDDYDGLISDILAQKRTIDNLYCHSSISISTVVSETKVIAIKCPVNVFVYDESGKEVVRIVNDIKKFVSDGIDVFVENGEKYIALPTDQKYSVKIIATDSGSMAYTVTEYGSGAERLRTVKKDNIPLVKNREFTGQIVVPMNVAPESYALTYDNKTVIADNVVSVPVTGVQLDVDNITMNTGETKKLSATVNPNNATNKGVTWSSDNPNVVEIDKDGNITALAIGVATITVSSNDWGFIDTCTITVSCAHTPANAWSTNSEHHWHICTVAGCGVIIETSKATHTPDHDGCATEEYAIKCSVCGYIIEAQLNHTHVFDKEVAEEQYLASKANCTDPAKYYKSCKCDEKGTETFASGNALGHTEGTDWKSDADNHWHECSVAGCGVIIDNSKAAHTPDRDAATESDPIKCSVCGYEITPALGHTHIHGTEWKSDKDNHWNECACGDKANTAAHNDANKDDKCDVCEYEVDIVIPDPDNKPEDTNKPSDDVHSPQTGDNSMMWLWITLLIVSGFGIIATVVMRKKFVR